MKNIFILFIFTVILMSCQDSTSVAEQKAIPLKFSEIANTPGFYWFDSEYNLYKPDNAIINQIKAKFDAGKYKIINFCNISCTCTTPQKEFAQSMKTLKDALIPETSFEIYSMSRETYSHPYLSNVKINSLPAIFIFKDNIAVYSLCDTLKELHKTYLDSNFKIEYFLLQGLSK